MTILGTIFTILGGLAAAIGLVENLSIAGQLARAFGGPGPGTPLLLLGVIGVITGVILINVGRKNKQSA